MKQIAREYIRNGLCALPASKARKMPALAGWKAYQKRLPLPTEWDAWNGINGICIVCGEVSGNLLMIDFDQQGKAFGRWKALIPAHLFEQLIIERSQSDGLHVVVRGQEPIGKNAKLAVDETKKILIETRGEGGLFLCAPTPGYELIQGTFCNIPVLSPDEIEILLFAAKSLSELAASEPASLPPQRIRDHFNNEGRPGDDFNQRGDIRAILQRHGWSFVKMDGNGVNELWRRPGKAFGNSASLHTQLPLFHVFSSSADPFDVRCYSFFDVYAILEHGGDHSEAAKTLAAEGFGDEIKPVSLPEFITVPPGIEPFNCQSLTVELSSSVPDIGADDSTSNGSRLKTTKNRHDSENPFGNENPNRFPKHLLNVPGFIATLSEFINDTSFVKQPVLALASAIAFQAFLCSHCVRDPMGTRPNVNILAVGRTASGKERGRKVIKEILSTLEHRPNRCYGNASKYFAEDVASYQALVQTLQSANGTLIWLWDEVGKVLPSLRADKTSHLSGLLPVIMRLYTSSDSTFVPHRRANAQDNLDPIHQPHLVLYGTSVPRNILEGFSVESLTDGLMGRFMFFEADDDAEDREDEMTKIPAVSEEILEVADWWMTKKASRINPKVPSPDTVPVNEDAAAEFRKLTELKRLARSSGDDVTLALWGRAVEQARQLALIYACSRDREKPTVDRDAASWACETVSYLIRRKIFLAARYVADDDFDRKQKEVIRFVETCKGRCTRTMMTNQFRNWDIRFRKNVFDNLFETEILTQVWKTSGKAGRPTAFVVLKKDR